MPLLLRHAHPALLDLFMEAGRDCRTDMTGFESQMQHGGGAALREASRFFEKKGAVWDTLRAVTARLSDLKIPYAVAGGMALNAHGYVRMTIDVDILVDSAGLAAIHRELADISYVPRRAGGKHLIDAKTQVQIDLLVAGGFAGDGRPNPIPIPSPKEAAVEIDGIRYVALPTLIELKLALGMKPGRLKHLADVQELIRVLKLPSNFADCLNGYVRAKYSELVGRRRSRWQ